MPKHLSDPVGMNMSVEQLPKWRPYSIYITTYHSDSKGRLESQDIIENLFKRYGGNYSKDSESLEFRFF